MAEPLILAGTSVAQHQMGMLQRAERELLAGRVKTVVLLLVDEKGQLAVQSAVPVLEVVGLLEMGKFAALQQPNVPRGHEH